MSINPDFLFENIWGLGPMGATPLKRLCEWDLRFRTSALSTNGDFVHITSDIR